MNVLASGTLASFEEQIQNTIGKPRYDLWFNGNTKLSFEDGALEIGVPNRFYREWLESHFQEEIRATCARVFGAAMAVRFKIDPTLFRRAHAQRPAPGAGQEPPKPVVKAPSRPSRYALTRFVAGAPNRVAHAAAVSVVENPKDGYSPLLIHGGVGLGKTHLLKGIEHAVRERFPQLKTVCISSEEFANQFIEAMHASKLSAFRKRFRQLDVLIIDDVQFLCGKKATQEEFFHTLNALHVRGAKVILACDMHPRRLLRITEELRSRFVSGIVAKIDAPNRDMRRQILRDKAAQRGLELRGEVIDFLAENLHSNVGELEGAINYLEHYTDTVSARLDLNTAKTALAEILRHSAPVVRISEVSKRACELFGIDGKSLHERSRSRAVAYPRMFVLYLARKFTQATFQEIGQQIGGLNHSTVIAAEKKIMEQLKKDGEITLGDRPWKVRDAIEAFERELGRS